MNPHITPRQEEVARELTISPRTARAHADALRSRLGVAYMRLVGLAV